DEMAMLRAAGIDLANLRISNRAHLVMPYHPLFDQLEERARGGAAIGTTGRGIGPAYADRASRTGIRVADLQDERLLQEKVTAQVAAKNRLLALYGGPQLEAPEILEACYAFAEQIEPYIAATEIIVQDALAAGREVLVEGAQAALLDLDFGTYPFVTSSFPTAAGSCAGAGIAPTQVAETIGVFKSYSTRVGGGPLVTELTDATGDTIRERGHEYGTTTGRPRRCGWFDAVAARYVVRLNDIGRAALTLLDVLDTFETVKICTGYRLDGEPLPYPPAREDLWARIEPVYEELPGWQADTTGARSAADLPANARRYIERVQELIGAPVAMVGVGPAREQLIYAE
ncbi:MAG TPA: adenylosuccinate synthase, partial [Thermomicrobiales bacterium]|nr:adenylosuccinate synthase [Thermomicrobiales bacterium]